MPWVYDYDQTLIEDNIIYNKQRVYIGNKDNKAELIYEAPKHWEEPPVDPTKSSFTEDEFIRVINQNDQSKMTIGAIVNLTNPYCSQYEVIDVNHDGTTNTVDLLAHTQVGNQTFGNTQTYSSSNVRAWINGTYLQAFSTNIQNLAKIMDVSSNDAILQDKVKLLSGTEVGYSHTYLTVEGTRYPVFSQTASGGGDIKRWRPIGPYGGSSYYWVRSQRNNSSTSVWYVNSSGYLNGTNCIGVEGVLPILRF